MEHKVQPKNHLAAVEGYNATFSLASYVSNSLSTLDTITRCFLSSNKTKLFLYEQFNPDCECWLDNQTICYHDVNSSSNADECCRFIVTLHILPRAEETLVFTCSWPDEYYNYDHEFVKHQANVQMFIYRRTSECK